MNAVKVFTAATAAAALMVAPAWALPSQVPSNPGTSHIPAGVPYSGTSNPGSSHIAAGVGPNASTKAKTMAYGEFCQTQSKRHVAGQHGTPFSKCVTDMAKLASGHAKNPTSACQGENKRHVAGQHGTPFSMCVSGAAKLLGSTQTTTVTTGSSTSS